MQIVEDSTSGERGNFLNGDDDEKDTPRREVRWTNKDSETLGGIIGGIIGIILFIWIAVTFF